MTQRTLILGLGNSLMSDEAVSPVGVPHLNAAVPVAMAHVRALLDRWGADPQWIPD